MSTAIGQLKESTQIVVNGVKSDVRGVKLPRTELVEATIAALRDNQVVLVHGDAGIGKSAVAHAAFTVLANGGLGIAFRAESFARPHLNEALFQYRLSLGTLNSQLALFDRKVIWIESIERLLERPDRDAFRDLLVEAKKNPALRILVSCRNYSVETVRTAFFADVGLGFVTVNVGELSETELEEVAVAVPTLARPLGSPVLRELMRIPFLLDKAVSMDWSAGESLPHDERGFRKKVWREVVRREDEPADGMPMIRSEAFVQVALRRARALTPFVNVTGLHAGGVHCLRRDSIITAAADDQDQVAPAHDVFEDWAIMQWLDATFGECGEQLSRLVDQMGDHPAIRRTYRKWLTERLSVDQQQIDTTVLELLSNGRTSQRWQEDTLVAVLLAPCGADFLLRNSNLLLREQAALLRRVIHMLRVACRQPISIGDGKHTVMLPSGRCWAAAADLLSRASSSFGIADAGFVVGFLEDLILLARFAGGYPRGSEHIGAVARHWLAITSDVESRSSRKTFRERLLTILLQIPLSVRDALEQMVRERLSSDERGHGDDDLLSLIYSHFDGSAICRDLPDLHQQVVEHIVGLSEESTREDAEPWFHRRDEVTAIFGINRHLEHKEFPASAYHGPFLRMLEHHPARALDFIVRLLNHASDGYARNSGRESFVEPPGRIAFVAPSGDRREIWANDRLWCLYRGASVGPYTLQSALMALERWLLQKADRGDSDVDSLLAQLLDQTNNVAIVAVVASVATANPHLAGRNILSLLSAPAFFSWDITRLAHEGGNNIATGMFPPSSAQDSVYRDERAQSECLPHRRQHLELAVAAAQTGSMRDELWAALDEHRAEIDDGAASTEEGKLWRLKLHRMDLRNFRPVKTTEEGDVYFAPSSPPADIQEMLERDRKPMEESARRQSLFLWAQGVWERKKTAEDAADWRQWLQVARQVSPSVEPFDWTMALELGGPIITAAVCLRDHLPELADDEKEWAAATVIGAVEAATEGDGIRGTSPFGGVAAAVQMLCALFGERLPDGLERRLVPALAAAVTCRTDDIATYVMFSIGTFLWPHERDLAFTCLNSIVEGAREWDAFFSENANRQLGQPDPLREFESRQRVELRRRIEAKTPVAPDSILSLDPEIGSGDDHLSKILAALIQHPEDPVARRFVAKVIGFVIREWDRNDEVRRGGRRRLNHRTESALLQQVARFALQLEEDAARELCRPIASQMGRQAGHVADFLRALTLEQDRREPTTTYWAVWQLVADALDGSRLSWYPPEYERDEQKVLRQLLLDISWKEDTRDWRPLAGNSDRLGAMFDNLPGSIDALTSYMKFLSTVGAQALPGALIRVAKKLEGAPADALTGTSAALHIESVLVLRPRCADRKSCNGRSLLI